MKEKRNFLCSSSSTIGNAQYSIRRRSLSPRLPQEAISLDLPTRQSSPKFQGLYDSLTPQCIPSTPIVHMEDVDDAYSQPTVLLVRKPTSTESEHLNVLASKALDASQPQANIPLSFVPSTPRSELLNRLQSVSSRETRLSQIPRLPTPDFSASGDNNLSIVDFFQNLIPKSVSAFSISPLKTAQEEVSSKVIDIDVSSITTSSDTNTRSGSNTLSGSTCPQSIRALSGQWYKRIRKRLKLQGVKLDSFTRHSSVARILKSNSNIAPVRSQSSLSLGSVGTGRLSLFPGIDTTDKFMHKWPRPSHVDRLIYYSSQRSQDKGNQVDSNEFLESDERVSLAIEHSSRWTSYKCWLLLSIIVLFSYSLVALVCSVLTWYQTWSYAEVMLVADNDILILLTLCSTLMLISALVGLAGTFLNSRPILAIYAILLWPSLISLLTVGYMSYKRAVFALDRKLNLAWSQWYTDLGRQIIQDSLGCCGFYDAIHEATLTKRCYPRTPLPGCKGPLLRFERNNLTAIWTTTFSILPLHLINIIIVILCANHVTRTFGKGIMPKAYRLRLNDVRINAESLLMHFANEARLPPIARHGSSLSYIREDKELPALRSRLSIVSFERNYREDCP